MITLMSKKLAKNSTFGKLSEEGPYQNNWLFKIGRVCFYEKVVMKFIKIIKFIFAYKKNNISLLCDSTMSNALNFCFLLVLLQRRRKRSYKKKNK